MGDYIRLSSGEAGRVVDMNWRNTTIRTATGNMVIVPNKSIATATLTNYEQPLAECTISIPLTITCSVSKTSPSAWPGTSSTTVNTASPASSPSSAMTRWGNTAFPSKSSCVSATSSTKPSSSTSSSKASIRPIKKKTSSSSSATIDIYSL
ncbi:mechanosensitive ion channel domain-containing protein [Megasphaera sp.]|uniref:mechanosensitive ion channel domain-containing protein n=1 Tax=Megasphaera sp. TaxID=2023260 RepID=UPI00345C33FC